MVDSKKKHDLRMKRYRIEGWRERCEEVERSRYRGIER